jgi:hypothetical protein
MQIKQLHITYAYVYMYQLSLSERRLSTTDHEPPPPLATAWTSRLFGFCADSRRALNIPDQGNHA